MNNETFEVCESESSCENFKEGNSCLFCYWNSEHNLGHFNLYSGDRHSKDAIGISRYVNVKEFLKAKDEPSSITVIREY